MKQLRIGYLSTMHHSSHVLKNLRLLEKELGIEPHWHLFGTGPAMVGAFAAGALDIGYIGLPPMIIAVGRGIPLVCIAGGHCEGTVMVGASTMLSKEECGCSSTALRQFKGLTIGTPAQGSIHDIIIRNMLEECGLAADCVVNYPWADLIAEDVRQGVLAAAVGTPPLAVMCQKWYGMKMILPPASLWPFNPSCGIAVHTSMLDEADLLRDFLILHENVCNMIRLDPGRAAAVIAEALKVVDVEFIQDVFAVSPRYCASLPEDYVESTMQFVPVLQKMGHVKETLSADQVFNCSFIEKTHTEPSHYYLQNG
jgi:NitT/TauT family transport system substrate-binding protein